MAHNHHHHRGHGSHEHRQTMSGDSGDRRVFWAVAINLLLTVAQIVGGVVAGSLSLIADAIHNLSDAVALGIAYVARRIARRPPDEGMTFGYGRAEIVAALVNYTTLTVIAIYLAYEAIWRFFEPQPVLGWIVVIVAGIALLVDVVTVVLTYKLSKESQNIRAAFLHNVADALGSVGVIVGGALIILFDWTIVDPIITLGISAYILWHVWAEIGATIRILMLGAPPDLQIRDLLGALREIPGIVDAHHLHFWQIDERMISLEGHLVLEPCELREAQKIRRLAKEAIRRFGVTHATFEIETTDEECPDGTEIGRTGVHIHMG